MNPKGAARSEEIFEVMKVHLNIGKMIDYGGRSLH
jgi:hypothetical protein